MPSHGGQLSSPLCLTSLPPHAQHTIWSHSSVCLQIKETPSWFRFNDASNRTVNNTVDSMTGVQSLETLAKWSKFDHEYMHNSTRMRTRQLQGAPNATAVAEKLKDAGTYAA